MGQIKIFKMNDCDWWAAETLEQAKEDCVTTFGGRYPEDAEEFLDDVREVPGGNMSKLRFVDPDESDETTASGYVERTFRQELNDRIERGEKFPQPFASTEY